MWRYWVKGQDYSEEDREYITRKRLKLSENHWKVCVCVCDVCMRVCACCVCVCVCHHVHIVWEREE